MDRSDGQDIKHYDSGEALAAAHHTDDATVGGASGSSQPGNNSDDPRNAGGIDPDEFGRQNSAAGFSVGGSGAGIERGPDMTGGQADSGPIDEAGAADTYGEERADLDFDSSTDPLGMGSNEDDDMITDER